MPGSRPFRFLTPRTGLLLSAFVLIAYALSDHPFYGGTPGFGGTQWAIAALGVVLLGCAFLPRSAATQALVLTIASAVTLGLSEWIGEAIFAPKFRPIFQYDEDLIFSFIPDRDSEMTLSPVNGGQTIRHRINKLGFRGPEFETHKDSLRIMVYGDSFIHASYTAREDTYAARLEQALKRESGRELQVINAGVSSYGPDQIAKKLERELPLYQPDLVIVAIYTGNDYSDLMRNKMFEINGDGQLVERAWQLSDDQKTQFEISQRTSILKRVASTVAAGLRRQDREDSASAVDITALLQNSENEYRSYMLDDRSIVTNTHVDYYNANISLTPDSVSTQYAITLMRGVIDRIQQLTRQNSARLALLLIPHASDVADTYDDWVLESPAFPGYNRRNLVSPLEQIASDLDLTTISLFAPFRENDANALYFHGGDDHWNSKGQRLAAEISAATLIQSGFLND